MNNLTKGTRTSAENAERIFFTLFYFCLRGFKIYDIY